MTASGTARRRPWLLRHTLTPNYLVVSVGLAVVSDVVPQSDVQFVASVAALGVLGWGLVNDRKPS